MKHVHRSTPPIVRNCFLCLWVCVSLGVSIVFGKFVELHRDLAINHAEIVVTLRRAFHSEREPGRMPRGFCTCAGGAGVLLFGRLAPEKSGCTTESNNFPPEHGAGAGTPLTNVRTRYSTP